MQGAYEMKKLIILASILIITGCQSISYKTTVNITPGYPSGKITVKIKGAKSSIDKTIETKAGIDPKVDLKARDLSIPVPGL